MATPDTTVGIGPVTNRTDGLISLHVGNSYVMLSPDEAKRLSADLASLALGARVIGFNLAPLDDPPA